jgi:hypothetical protein
MLGLDKLKKLLKWKLLSGSHAFPGPDGGTCINEAAIVVAGFPYKKVGAWTDCPPCFSPVLSGFLIALNDTLYTEPRQELTRYVLRLSGSADKTEIEIERAWALYDGIAGAAAAVSPFRFREATRMAYEEILCASDELKMYSSPSGLPDWVRGDQLMNNLVRATACCLCHIVGEMHRLTWSPPLKAPLTVAKAAAMNSRPGAPQWGWFLGRTLETLDKAFAIGNQAPKLNEALIERRVRKAKKAGQKRAKDATSA